MIVIDFVLAYLMCVAFAVVGGLLAYAFQRIGDKILDRIGGY